MDYLFLSSIRFLGCVFLTIVASYDIACQFFKNFVQRVQSLPPSLQRSFTTDNMICRVPKAHLPAHVDECQGPFSLGYSEGVGTTYGEGPEHGWSGFPRH